MERSLLIGTAEIDITPDPAEVVYLAGDVNDPRGRQATGTHDPLFVRTLVLKCGETTLALTAFDALMLHRETVRQTLAAIQADTGIPEDHLVWWCSHTHSAPMPELLFPDDYGRVHSPAVQRRTLDAYRRSVRAAADALRPAVLRRLRGFECSVGHNRRLRFKDGREINTWLLDRCDDVQCLGSAGPIDPEVGILAFDDPAGKLLAVLYQVTLHANLRWGSEYSADYPGVIAERIKDGFGSHVTPVYMSGAGADVNGVVDCDRAGNLLADVVCAKLHERRALPAEAGVSIGAERREVALAMRDFGVDQDSRIEASKWPPDGREFFRRSARQIGGQAGGVVETVAHAWHVGDVAFAGIPGELFVQWGIALKERSAFPWTYPVTLCGDWQGYLITAQAWEGIGYEGLLASTGKVSADGAKQLVDHELDLLARLRKRQVCDRHLPAAVTLRDGTAERIRALRADDGEALGRFYACVPAEDYRFYCPHPLDRDHALRKAAEADSATFVCVVLEDRHGELAGYAWYRWEAGEDRSDFGICVRRDHQGSGCGKALMTSLLAVAADYGPPVMTLTVQKANPGAVALYGKMGFRIVREQLRGFDQEPEYAMERSCVPLT